MDINNVLEFDKQNSLFTLVESNTDGSFLVHFFISNCIKQTSAKTFLITLSQTFSHYKSVQTKLGNLSILNNLITNEKFFSYDLMNKINENSSTNFFDDVLSKIQTSIQKSSNEKFYVIIDDLSVAQLTGFADNKLLKFITQLQSLSDELHLIVYSQSFYSNKYFINDLVHMSDLYFKVEPLSTGFSKDIQGQVIFS